MSDREDEGQELIGLAEDFGLCFCEPAWTERGRRDPQCDYHDRVELISDVLAWLIERDAKRDLELKAETWDEGLREHKQYEKACWDQVYSLTNYVVPPEPVNPYRDQ